MINGTENLQIDVSDESVNDDEEDLANFKGIYYENDSEKYFSPRTGAHF